MEMSIFVEFGKFSVPYGEIETLKVPQIKTQFL